MTLSLSVVSGSLKPLSQTLASFVSPQISSSSQQPAPKSRVSRETTGRVVDALLKWMCSRAKHQDRKDQHLLDPHDDLLYLVLTLKKVSLLYLVLTLKKVSHECRTTAYRIPLPQPIFSPASVYLLVDDRLKSPLPPVAAHASSAPSPFPSPTSSPSPICAPSTIPSRRTATRRRHRSIPPQPPPSHLRQLPPLSPVPLRNPHRAIDPRPHHLRLATAVDGLRCVPARDGLVLLCDSSPPSPH